MPLSLKDLIDEYIFQREGGASPEQALKALAERHPGLSPDQRQQIGQAIRRWEHQQEQADYPASNAAPESAQCPHCGTDNPPHAKYCYACGQVIDMGQIGSQTSHLPDEEEDPATFGNMATLVIWVRDHDDPLYFRIQQDRPLTIGRSDPSSPQKPDIDFATYKGKDLGVSRRHALLKRAGKTLTMVDGGSVNHTYINGEKLHPHEVRVIRDGDEVRFGHLMTRFTFHREVRPLN